MIQKAIVQASTALKTAAEFAPNQHFRDQMLKANELLLVAMEEVSKLRKDYDYYLQRASEDFTRLQAAEDECERLRAKLITRD